MKLNSFFFISLPQTSRAHSMPNQWLTILNSEILKILSAKTRLRGKEKPPPTELFLKKQADKHRDFR